MGIIHYAMSAGAVLYLALSGHARNVGNLCSVDSDCNSDCCSSQRLPQPQCELSRALATGAACLTRDGCDCDTGHCDNGECAECGVDGDCESGCCASQKDGRPCVPSRALASGVTCFTQDGCDCETGHCDNGECAGCGVDEDCESGCCASQKDGRPCVPSGALATGATCFTNDGCDCDTGHCENGVCADARAPTPPRDYDEQECGVNGDCESGCCASQQDGRPCVPFMAIPNGQQCFTIDGCDCASGTCSSCPVPGCIGRVCAEEELPSFSFNFQER